MCAIYSSTYAYFHYICAQPITSRTVLHLIQPTERQTCSAMNSNWSTQRHPCFLVNYIHQSPAVYLFLSAAVSSLPVTIFNRPPVLPAESVSPSLRSDCRLQQARIPLWKETYGQKTHSRQKQNIIVTWGGNSLSPKYTLVVHVDMYAHRPRAAQFLCPRLRHICEWLEHLESTS